jgi:hypothetical protein
MRAFRVATLAVLLAGVAGCAGNAPALSPPPKSGTSQVAAAALAQEYLDKFLTPATAYALSPRCPQPAGAACSDPAIIVKLQAAQKSARRALDAAQHFADAAPTADASGALSAARQALTAAEAIIPSGVK